MRALICLLLGFMILYTATAHGYTECEYFDECKNGGRCGREEDGVEYCICPEEFTGPFCEWEHGSCDKLVCQNGGSCYNESGIRVCVCQPGFSGDRCEVEDDSTYCPVPGENDMVFLPICTLKTTLTKLAGCINDQLPLLRPCEEGANITCHEKVTKVKHCFYRTIRGCSGVKCEGAYWYGGVRLYINIAEKFYDPMSNFSIALNKVLCTPPDEDGTFSQPDEPFNIGEPVCTSDLIDRLLKIASVSATNLPYFDSSELCPHLAKLKMDLYNVVDESCDWSNIFEALPYLRNASMRRPMFWPDALEMAQEFFKEWFLPGCADDSGIGCPTITSRTPRCKIADVWMCHYFSYKRAFSQWTVKFMKWWDGCFSHDERNWNDWASSMGVNRGDGRDMTGGHGKPGFIRMILANMQCSDFCDEDCTGEVYYTALGCTICYSAGRPRNPQRIFATWLQEYQQFQMAMRLVAKLREECSGTTMGCGDDFSSTMAPPNFPTTGWPDM